MHDELDQGIREAKGYENLVNEVNYVMRHMDCLPQMPVDGMPTMRIFGFGADGKQCVPQGKFKLQSALRTRGWSCGGRPVAKQRLQKPPD